jgi:predicted nucleic acid-binding protein
MKAVFADTSYYVALLNDRDVHHAAAISFGESDPVGIVTTEFVLLEVATFFRRPGDHAVFVRFDSRLRTDSQTAVLPATTELYKAGLALFSARSDKEWSLTDCTSFAVMAERKLTDALTADVHFVQAGFKALLLEESS